MRYPTVVLLHETGSSSHHDWMLLDPACADQAGRELWTARVEPASDQWRRLVEWDVEPIEHHRKDFLTYEGPLTRDRGSVRRIDEGEFEVRSWRDDCIEIELTMRHFGGPSVVRIARMNDQRWRARLV